MNDEKKEAEDKFVYHGEGDGTLYVRADRSMIPFVRMLHADMTVSTFGDGKVLYLKVADVIKHFENAKSSVTDPDIIECLEGCCEYYRFALNTPAPFYFPEALVEKIKRACERWAEKRPSGTAEDV